MTPDPADVGRLAMVLYWIESKTPASVIEAWDALSRVRKTGHMGEAATILTIVAKLKEAGR